MKTLKRLELYHELVDTLQELFDAICRDNNNCGYELTRAAAILKKAKEVER